MHTTAIGTLHFSQIWMHNRYVFRSVRASDKFSVINTDIFAAALGMRGEVREGTTHISLYCEYLVLFFFSCPQAFRYLREEVKTFQGKPIMVSFKMHNQCLHY